jgi:hypothetical protein
MAPDPYRRTNGTASTAGAGASPPDSSYLRLQLDNLLRRELRVSDPGDPRLVAEALLSRYQNTPRARAIEQEARGLPVLQITQLPMPIGIQQQSSSSAELTQALDDVDRDLKELTTNTLLKDVTPELEGWAQAVRSAIREGTAAARFGLDPRQRDKAMAIRRQLGDYARLARLIGAFTPNMSQTYRKFAQSLDEVAALILVLIGESLANAGFNGGQFLLQVAYSDLQVRRDAAIYALRNLVGSTQEAYGPSEWPRGIDAYRRLYDRLEEQGQGDLRSLLVEEELARVMDELIQRAAHGNPEGLRALSATAQIDLQRIRRLIAIGFSAAVPESPPLAAFLEALQLFADAFTSAGGARLVRIARPPILLYGLYGANGIGRAEQALLGLIIARSRLADLLDCYLGCSCEETRVECQVMLDSILHDIDRAIDLYALGTQDFGEPERRAAAYAFVVEAFERIDRARPANAVCLPRVGGAAHAAGMTQHQLDEDMGESEFSLPSVAPVSASALPALASSSPIRDLLRALRAALRPPISTADPTLRAIFNDLRGAARQIEAQLRALQTQEADALADRIAVALLAVPNPPGELEDVLVELRQLVRLYRLAWRGALLLQQNRVAVIWPGSVAAFFEPLTNELCVQRRAEERWQDLVKTMSPSCLRQGNAVLAGERLIADALVLVAGTCEDDDVKIPPDIETSLDNLVNATTVTGGGRWP